VTLFRPVYFTIAQEVSSRKVCPHFVFTIALLIYGFMLHLVLVHLRFQFKHTSLSERRASTRVSPCAGHDPYPKCQCHPESPEFRQLESFRSLTLARSMSRVPIFTRRSRASHFRSGTCTSTSSGADTSLFSISDSHSSFLQGSQSSVDWSHVLFITKDLTFQHLPARFRRPEWS
jgi:hypothetical protein